MLKAHRSLLIVTALTLFAFLLRMVHLADVPPRWDEGWSVAHASLGCVLVLSEQGEVVARMESCRGRTVTNLVLDGGRALITESATGTILEASWADPPSPPR